MCTADDRPAARAVLERLREPGDDLDAEVRPASVPLSLSLSVCLSSTHWTHPHPHLSCLQIRLIVENHEQNLAAQSATWADVFEWRAAVELGVVLMVIMCQTGANSLFYYSSTIFGFAGVNDAILGTVIVYGALFLVTVFSARVVDLMGRRTLLLGGTAVMLVALLTLSTSLWFGDGLGETQGIIAVAAVVLFVIGWGLGLGAALWVGKLLYCNVVCSLNISIIDLFLCLVSPRVMLIQCWPS